MTSPRFSGYTVQASRLFTAGIAALLLVLFTAKAPAAEPLPLQVPAVYAGEYNKDGETCRALLSLASPQGFLLREEILLSNGKISTWDTTGKWHQIRGGAFLQLSNSSDLRRLINIGGAGNLYLGMHLPTGKQVTVILRAKDTAPPAYEVTGTLRQSGSACTFEDTESGVVHNVLPGNAVTSFLQQQKPGGKKAFFVTAEMTAAKSKTTPAELHLKNIRSATEKLFEVSTGYFLSAVVGHQWRVTRLGQGTPVASYMLSFLPNKESTGGRLDVFDGMLHLTGSYTVQNSRLSLTVTTAEPRFAAFIEATRSWHLSGEVLELWGDGAVLALLEKAR